MPELVGKRRRAWTELWVKIMNNCAYEQLRTLFFATSSFIVLSLGFSKKLRRKTNHQQPCPKAPSILQATSINFPVTHNEIRISSITPKNIHKNHSHTTRYDMHRDWIPEVWYARYDIRISSMIEEDEIWYSYQFNDRGARKRVRNEKSCNWVIDP